VSSDLTSGSQAATPLPEGTVTVLFTDLVESTQLNQQHGDEIANAIRREVEQSALELIERHRGVVVKGLGDGLMVAFQSARRAVACARDIQIAVNDRNREHPSQRAAMRIGLHTGEVIEDSGDLHGETVIIAKRIEGVAPSGGIFASDTVHGVLGTARAELVDRGEFELKGIDAPWRLYEVPVAYEHGSAVLADADRSPYVGRAKERELFDDLVARAAGGHGGMVFVTGEAGAGKSRLIQEGAALALDHGMAVLVGHCLDMDAPPPYQPLVEQLDQAARALAPEIFRELLGDNAPEVARLMPELHRIYSDIGESPNLPPDQERRYLLHGFGRFVERAALRRPLVLCFEDLHWADESSLLLITALAQIAAELPLLLVASYRPGDVGPRHVLSRTREELTRGRLATEIRLAALSESDVALLLAGRAGQPPPPLLVALIYAETEGNPFFVEEVFLHLKERGALFDEDGRWLAGVAIADTEVPRTVRLVIERRLERVGDDVRKALTAAAVAGRTASFELLLITAGLDEDALLDAVEEAEHANLVDGQNRGGEVVYSFVHEQIRQTLLADLSAPRRQRMHVRVADAMGQLLGPAADQRAADIAHHLQLAGTAAPRDRTIHYLEFAARNAVAAVAPEDAIRHVDAALELVGDGAHKAGLLAIRAQAHRAIPRIDEALADLARALELAPGGAAHDAILRQRAGLHLDLFDGPAASADLDVALDAVRARGDRAAELDTLLALARAHYVRALDEQAYAPIARATYEETYALAAEMGDTRAMIEALLPTAWFTDYWVDYMPIARANVEEAVRLAAELGDERLSIEAQTAALRFVAGPEIAARAEELRERLEALHDPVRLKEHYFWLMWHYLARGQLERCVETCDLGIDLARQLGSAPVQYGSIKALALVELGRYDLVDAALDQEVTDDAHPFGQANQAFARAHYLAALEAWEPAASASLDAMQRASSLSRVWMQSGLLAVAVTLAARAADAVRAETSQIEAMAGAAGVRSTPLACAEAELAAGQASEARDRLERWVAALIELEGHRDAARTLECLGRAWTDLGNWDEALATADRGLSLTTRTGQTPLTWRFRGCRANVLDQLGRAAEATEERARAAADFDTLAERIADPVLRRWFVRQPLAARWLGRSDDITGEEAER
jgi:class 3 adenylate cyclase/tetratricopeptide (TPR) repeat protein